MICTHAHRCCIAWHHSYDNFKPISPFFHLWTISPALLQSAKIPKSDSRTTSPSRTSSGPSWSKASMSASWQQKWGAPPITATSSDGYHPRRCNIESSGTGASNGGGRSREPGWNTSHMDSSNISPWAEHAWSALIPCYSWPERQVSWSLPPSTPSTRTLTWGCKDETRKWHWESPAKSYPSAWCVTESCLSLLRLHLIASVTSYKRKKYTYSIVQ